MGLNEGRVVGHDIAPYMGPHAWGPYMTKFWVSGMVWGGGRPQHSCAMVVHRKSFDTRGLRNPWEGWRV